MRHPRSWSGGPAPGILTVVLALIVGAAAAPRAQFRSGVSSVEVYATVTGAGGAPVLGLTRDDFELREGGESQQISIFESAEFPLSVALAIDRSFSMSGTRLGLAKAAARTFLGELRPQDESMLVAVGSEVEVLSPLSSDRTVQYTALARLARFGTTGLHDALIQTIDAIQPARGRRALVLLSDGDDRYSKASASEALAHARRSDVLIFPVALGATRPPLFAELASVTGGRSAHSRDAASLAATLRGVARELRHQYLLGYTPSRPVTTGSNEWRSIVVTVKRPGARVRARDGYLVK